MGSKGALEGEKGEGEKGEDIPFQGVGECVYLAKSYLYEPTHNTITQ